MLLLAVDAGNTDGSPWALIVIVLLAAATVLLIRNMSARLKRMPPSFDVPPDERDQADEPGSDDAR